MKNNSEDIEERYLNIEKLKNLNIKVKEIFQKYSIKFIIF